jgi:hypothetical protein
VRFAGDVMEPQEPGSPEVAYSPQEKAEDQLLLRAIQRGEIGNVPQKQIDELINRINGVRRRGV